MIIYEFDVALKELDPYLIVKNSVINETLCNSEIYLRELLNKSKYFLTLTKGEKFSAPETECNGECDCITSCYKLDLKLLVSSSTMNYLSECTPIITKKGNNEYNVQLIRKREGMYVVDVEPMLFKATIEDIENHRFGEDELIVRDLTTFVSLFSKRKNLLFLYPKEIIPQKEEQYEVEETLTGLSRIYQSIFLYRETILPEYDSFLSIIRNDILYISKWENGQFKLVDRIDMKGSETYMKLMIYRKCIDASYRGKN